MSRSERGSAAERYVAGRLQRDGYRVLESNWRTRYGEIDIVAVQNDVLVFVEVRARTGSRLGHAEESVSRRKLDRVMNAALAYIEQHPEYADQFWRVDLVAVTLDPTGAVQRFRHFENITLD